MEADTAPPPDATTLTVIDGYLVDDSGEIVGHAHAGTDFHIRDKESAEWVLKRFLDCDTAIAALDMEETAILANIDTVRRQHAARRKYLEWRFKAELASYANAVLRGRGKTWTCAYGSVATRTVPPRIEIVDEAKAISWLRTRGLGNAIKVKESVILAECKPLLKDPPQEGHGIIVRESSESVTIRSGVSS